MALRVPCRRRSWFFVPGSLGRSPANSSPLHSQVYCRAVSAALSPRPSRKGPDLPTHRSLPGLVPFVPPDSWKATERSHASMNWSGRTCIEKTLQKESVPEKDYFGESYVASMLMGPSSLYVFSHGTSAKSIRLANLLVGSLWQMAGTVRIPPRSAEGSTLNPVCTVPVGRCNSRWI